MNRIDAIRPDSPRLAGPGPLPVGVQTRVLGVPPRALTVEIWYPAAPNTERGGAYDALLRDGATRITLHGRATREAPAAEGRWPLVLLSHGWPGTRHLMAHLAESLASRGYLVAAADHAGSTYDDQRPIADTLLNRPLDQRALLAELGRDARALPGVAAIVGYSMGGYGALVTAGAGVTPEMVAHEMAPAHGALARHLEARVEAAPDALRAVITFGPWGNGAGVWRPEALAAVRAPVLVIAGSVDTISNYPAMRAIAEATRGTLLTFQNAGHNAGAPIPAPAESHAHSPRLGWAPFLHYADPVWDSVRMNAVAQHFCAAFLDRHLKGDASAEELLDPAQALSEAAGFAPGHAAGLTLERWG